MPTITSLEQHWEDKETGRAWVPPAAYEGIHMPRNTGAGFIISGFAFVLGFAVIWNIWWLAALGLFGMIAAFIVRSYDRDTDYWMPAVEVERIEKARYALLQEARP